MKTAGGVVSKSDSSLSRHCCLLGHEQRHMVCTCALCRDNIENLQNRLLHVHVNLTKGMSEYFI